MYYLRYLSSTHVAVGVLSCLICAPYCKNVLENSLQNYNSLISVKKLCLVKISSKVDAPIHLWTAYTSKPADVSCLGCSGV